MGFRRRTRKRTAKRRISPYKKALRMSMSVRSRERAQDSVVVTVTKTVNTIVNLNIAGASSVAYAGYFYLGAINNFSQIAATYDQYRIVKVRRRIFAPYSYSNTPSVTLSVPPNFAYCPMLYSAIDYDDASSPSGVAQMLDYGNCQSARFQGEGSKACMSMTFTPKPALAAYSGAFTSYAEGEPGQWLNCSSPNIQHYGHKCVWDFSGFAYTGTANTWGQVTFVDDYVIQFKQIH